MAKRQPAEYRVAYVCPNCGEEWEDITDSPSDDTCPECETSDIEPVSAEPVK